MVLLNLKKNTIAFLKIDSHRPNDCSVNATAYNIYSNQIIKRLNKNIYICLAFPLYKQ